MLDLNEEHPAFDMAMEVLCMLPRQPLGSRLADIRNDLGLSGHNNRVRANPTLRQMINTLRSWGHDVRTCNAGGQCFVSIARGGWEESIRAGQNYWNTVYGKPSTLAVTR